MSKGSSNTARKRRKTGAILLAVYLFGLAFGCFLIWLIPVTKNKSDLLTIANDKGEQLLSAGLKDEVMIFGMEHWLYNSSGSAISHDAAFLHVSQYEYIHSFVPDVLERGQIFKPSFLLLENGDDEPRWIFGIIVGVAVESSRGQRFASIVLRDLPDLGTTMVTYISLFTFMYAVGAFFVFYIFNKERELNRMRRDLIANVSHELKTPITAIRAMAETLHDGMIKDPETKRMYSSRILEESDNLEKLVLDILELSKLQNNHALFRRANIHADGMIPPIVDRYMMLCGDMGITLDTSGLKLEEIPMLYTDAEKMVTLINILMDNAVKFTGKGGTIWISSQLHARHATFCIRDNGPGIRSEDVNRIFDRFYKADTAHNSSGSGLGLAIAEEIARGLGEDLWVESKFGVGTSFYFTIEYK